MAASSRGIRGVQREHVRPDARIHVATPPRACARLPSGTPRRLRPASRVPRGWFGRTRAAAALSPCPRSVLQTRPHRGPVPVRRLVTEPPAHSPSAQRSEGTVETTTQHPNTHESHRRPNSPLATGGFPPRAGNRPGFRRGPARAGRPGSPAGGAALTCRPRAAGCPPGT